MNLLAFCVASLVASAAFAADLTAAQIVDKNVAARGGLTAWRAVQSMSMTGEMDAGGKTNVKLPFVMIMKRPHKSRLELRFDGQTAVQTYDGAQGWKLRPFLGRNEVDAFTPAEAKSAAASDELDGPLVDYASKGTRVEVVGTDKVDGRNAYKLKLTRKAGEPRNLWIDATTFLELKIDGEPRKMDAKVHKVVVFYRDFKTVNGLNIPHTLETVVEGIKGSHKMTIQSVAVNRPVEDALFTKPHVPVATPAIQ